LGRDASEKAREVRVFGGVQGENDGQQFPVGQPRRGALFGAFAYLLFSPVVLTDA